MLAILICSVLITGALAQELQVKTNRYIVLDDPNNGSKAAGFFDPTDVRGGSWGSSYWSGESTTIRAIALTLDNSGSPKQNVQVNFALKDPVGTPIHSASVVTDTRGLASYSYNLDNKNYWGYWKIDVDATIDGVAVQNSTSFAYNWWGCTQCHGKEDPGKWGTIYTPKSFYTMGYDFHKSQQKNKHTDAMAKGTCIICHQMYNGTAINWGFTGNSPNINPDNEYSPDWHNGKVKCQGCHQGSDISSTPQGKNPEIAGCYDTSGCHTQKNPNVTAVKSTTGYAIEGNYRTNYSYSTGNIAKAHTVGGIECVACHSSGHSLAKPYNDISTSNSNTEKEQCWTCHTERTTGHYGTNCIGCHTQDAHNMTLSASMAAAGEGGCLSCHNDHQRSDSHTNINSNAVASGVDLANKKCWGCHQTDGSQPSTHGGSKSPPYQCQDCHGPNKPYDNVANAPTIFSDGGGSGGSGIAIKSVTASAAGDVGHNGTVGCLDCHGSAHAIGYIQPDGSYNGRATAATCIDCHQTGTVPANNSLFATAYVLANQLNHSNDPGSGSLWTRSGDPVFWNSIYNACLYCHGFTIHSPNALGKSKFFKDTNHVRQFGTWCAACHYDKYPLYDRMVVNMSPVPPEITGNITYGNYVGNPKYYNHSEIGDFQDNTCKGCHGNRPDASVLMHNVASGQSGPDCVSCHDISAGVAPALIDESSMSQADSIHKDLNKDAASTVNAKNKKCWACHGDGTEPTQHPSGYKSPATCTDCHSGTNTNFNPSAILNVSEHYWNGEQIITSGVSSCYQCHNKSEMMIAANDPDSGTGAVNGGLNAGNNSTSHYGKKRGDLASIKDTRGYCDYCHNSTTSPSSSFFDVFVDIDNRNIQNHSSYGTNPECKQCHSVGRIHNSTLTFDVLTLPTSTTCLGCHGPGGTASIKDKSKHNSSVNCSVCHLNTGKDIHPIKYLQNGGSFGINKLQGVTCDGCHQNGLYGSPAIGKLQHADNPWNGSLWNAGRPSIFWNNNSIGTACIYCHGDSKHNITALGKLVGFKGSNIVNVFGTWCGTCHYRGNSLFSTMLGVMGPLVPPEISKDPTYGSYAQARDGTQYFNHSLATYSDNRCGDCHYSGPPSNLTQLMHDTRVGGSSCRGCHPTVGTTQLGKHINVSKTEGVGVLSDNDCVGCHFDLTRLDQMLPDYANFSNTYYCNDCHNATGRNTIQYNNITDPNLKKDNVRHAMANCTQCHINDYHPNGPLGTAVGKNCYSCHYRSDGTGNVINNANVGLNDPPNAPGEDHTCNTPCHYTIDRPSLNGQNGCPNCHLGTANNHNVRYGSHYSPRDAGIAEDMLSISNVAVTPSSASAGTIVNVTAQIKTTYVQIAKAQYRINNSANTVIIRDWTDMNATDGKFNGRVENVIGNLNTAGLSGSYKIIVRGMASGYWGQPAGGITHNPNKPYYPNNGIWTNAVVRDLQVTGLVGWIKLSGSSNAHPSITAFNNRVYAMVIGDSNAIYIGSAGTDNVWTSWSVTGGTVLSGTGPAITTFNNRLYAMVIGTDNGIYVRSMGTDNIWSVWTKLSGKSSKNPSIYAFNNRLYAMVIGSDNGIYINSMGTNNVWSGWTKLSGSSNIGPSITLFNNRLYATVIGNDNGIYVNSMGTDNVWSGWIKTSGTSNIDPSITTFNSKLYLMVRGMDGKIYIKNMGTDNIWSGWNIIPADIIPGILTGPSIHLFNNKLYGMIVGNDNGIYMNGGIT